MATLTAINIKNQDAKRMVGSLNYITQDHKAEYEGRLLFSGHNCLPENSYLEMMSTKERFHKTDGILYYHYVQSFANDENITPQEAHQIGLELAAELFPDYEAVVATHVDTDNLHSHIIVNSVSFQTGRKLHQNKNDLVRQRAANDKICKRHNLEVLPPYQSGGQRMKPGEYQAMLREDSWKLDLIRAIEEALEYSPDRESFITNMEYEGYQVI